MERVFLEHISGHTNEGKMTGNSHHGFIKDKSRLIILTAFYDKMSDSWTRSTLDVIHIDFSKGFDTVSHNVLIHKLGPKCLSR